MAARLAVWLEVRSLGRAIAIFKLRVRAPAPSLLIFAGCRVRLFMRLLGFIVVRLRQIQRRGERGTENVLVQARSYSAPPVASSAQFGTATCPGTSRTSSARKCGVCALSADGRSRLLPPSASVTAGTLTATQSRR